MEAAAERHPRLTARFLVFKPEERDEHIALLKKQLEIEGRSEDVTELFLVQGHVEVVTQASLGR